MLNTKQLRLLRKSWNEQEDMQYKQGFNWAVMALACIIILLLACIIILLLASCTVFASNNVNMAHIARIESSNNPDAYNKRSHARGLCQITPIVLTEFNRLNRRNFTLDDLFIDQVNMLVADWYANVRIPALLKHYKIADTVRNRIWAYNAGIGNVVKHRLPRETGNYFIKYEGMK